MDLCAHTINNVVTMFNLEQKIYNLETDFASYCL